MTDLPTSQTSRPLTAARLLLAVGVLTAVTIGVFFSCGFVGQFETTRGVFQMRLERLATAATVGAALAAAGMALQGLLRNPLAEPYILGISSGAGVGVLIGMSLVNVLFLPEWLGTPILAFASALLTCLVVYAVAQRRGRLDPYSLILSGVIINAFNGALMLALLLFLDPIRVAAFAQWGMGELRYDVDRPLLAAGAVCVVGGWFLLFLRGSAYNALGLGDDVAGSAGVSVHRLRIETFAIVGLMTAASVALAGPIGFLGLIVPHICRMVVGPDHRLLAIVSGFAGAIFLMLADTLCRTIGPYFGVSDIPVGILTALCGGPFFIYLLRRRLREGPA